MPEKEDSILTVSPDLVITSSQKKPSSIFLKLFFLLGERIAIIALLIVGSFLFFIDTPKAFSKDPELVKQQPSVISFNGTYKDEESSSTIQAVVKSEIAPSPTPTPIIDPGNDDIWDKLADCESHKNWSSNTGNGYYGGLQFSQGAWESVGGIGNPSTASRDEQIGRGKLLQSRRGWGPWGGCAKKLGLN